MFGSFFPAARIRVKELNHPAWASLPIKKLIRNEEETVRYIL
jgi:hypothetical protein